MLLIDYMRDKFDARPGDATEAVEIKKHMLARFGVDVTVEGDLFLFKYNMLLAKWTEPVVHECRGTILRRDADLRWAVATRPWNKFFNHFEGYSPVSTPQLFEKYVKENRNAYLTEKADGTCIQMWFDAGASRWRASTLGSITTGFANRRGGATFEEMFWQTMLDRMPTGGKFIDDGFVKGFTYLFELCTDTNRIITKYDRPMLFLLAARHTVSGCYMENAYLDGLATSCGLDRPRRIVLADEGITTKESVIEFVETQSGRTDLYGRYPEGFVLHTEWGKPVAKFKNAAYTNLVPLSGATPERWVAALTRIFFAGSVDDVREFLSEAQVRYVERLGDWYRAKVVEILAEVDTIRRGGPYENQKAYALKVGCVKDTKVKGMLFKLKDKVLGDALYTDDINAQFADNWEAYKTEIATMAEEGSVK